MAPQWLQTLFLAIILAGQGIVNGLTLDVDDEGELRLQRLSSNPATNRPA